MGKTTLAFVALKAGDQLSEVQGRFFDWLISFIIFLPNEISDASEEGPMYDSFTPSGDEDDYGCIKSCVKS